MRLGFRLVAMCLVVAVGLGPLVTVASAQTAPAKPEMFPEVVKTTEGAPHRTDAYDVGAGFANVFVTPGRAIVCTLGTVGGTLLLAITFGSAYREAAATVREGCEGKWYVTGDDLRPTDAVPNDYIAGN